MARFCKETYKANPEILRPEIIIEYSSLFPPIISVFKAIKQMKKKYKITATIGQTPIAEVTYKIKPKIIYKRVKAR